MGETLVKVYGNTDVGGVGTPLNPADINISNLLFNMGSYVHGRDLTFLGQVENALRAGLIRTLVKSGVVEKVAPTDGDELNPDWGEVSVGTVNIPANSFVLGKSHAILNGYQLLIAGSDSEDEGNLITLNAPPSSATRYDLVFLEFWFREVSPSATDGNVDADIFNYGGKDSGENVNVDLLDSAIGVETMRCVQLQWRIRVYGTGETGVLVSTTTVEDSAIKARGANDTDTTLTFSLDTWDNNISRAGSGSEADAITLGTVDGYSYAFPLFRVVRATGDTAIGTADLTDLRQEAYLRIKAAGVIS